MAVSQHALVGVQMLALVVHMMLNHALEHVTPCAPQHVLPSVLLVIFAMGSATVVQELA
jgi:hypothetical protein